MNCRACCLSSQQVVQLSSPGSSHVEIRGLSWGPPSSAIHLFILFLSLVFRDSVSLCVRIHSVDQAGIEPDSAPPHRVLD